MPDSSICSPHRFLLSSKPIPACRYFTGYLKVQAAELTELVLLIINTSYATSLVSRLFLQVYTLRLLLQLQLLLPVANVHHVGFAVSSRQSWPLIPLIITIFRQQLIWSLTRSNSIETDQASLNQAPTLQPGLANKCETQVKHYYIMWFVCQRPTGKVNEAVARC